MCASGRRAAFHTSSLAQRRVPRRCRLAGLGGGRILVPCVLDGQSFKEVARAKLPYAITTRTMENTSRLEDQVIRTEIKWMNYIGPNTSRIHHRSDVDSWFCSGYLLFVPLCSFLWLACEMQASFGEDDFWSWMFIDVLRT